MGGMVPQNKSSPHRRDFRLRPRLADSPSRGEWFGPTHKGFFNNPSSVKFDPARICPHLRIALNLRARVDYTTGRASRKAALIPTGSGQTNRPKWRLGPSLPSRM